MYNKPQKSEIILMNYFILYTILLSVSCVANTYSAEHTTYTPRKITVDNISAHQVTIHYNRAPDNTRQTLVLGPSRFTTINLAATPKTQLLLWYKNGIKEHYYLGNSDTCVIGQ